MWLCGQNQLVRNSPYIRSRVLGLLEVLLGKPGTMHSPGTYLPHPGLPAEPSGMIQHKKDVGNLVRGRMLAPSFHNTRVSLPCYQAEDALAPTRITAPCTLYSGTLRLYTRGPLGSVTRNIAYLWSGRRGGAWRNVPPAATGEAPGNPAAPGGAHRPMWSTPGDHHAVVSSR